VNERSVAAREFVYLMLNQAARCDYYGRGREGAATVYNFLDKEVPWVAPVGRLDKASEGLLLLTNDSEWSARILAPESHVEKVYHVQIVLRIRMRLWAGWNLERSRRANCSESASVGAEARSQQRVAEMVLNEGKNRHIRKMMEACGVEVLRLLRVSIARCSWEPGQRKVRELLPGKSWGWMMPSRPVGPALSPAHVYKVPRKVHVSSLGPAPSEETEISDTIGFAS